jgi:hypothetical protein
MKKINTERVSRKIGMGLIFGLSFINTSFGTPQKLNPQELFLEKFHGWDDFGLLRSLSKTRDDICAILERVKNMPYSMLREEIINYCERWLQFYKEQQNTEPDTSSDY